MFVMLMKSMRGGIYRLNEWRRKEDTLLVGLFVQCNVATLGTIQEAFIVLQLMHHVPCNVFGEHYLKLAKNSMPMLLDDSS